MKTLSSISLDEQTVNDLISSWKNSLPVELGNLFTHKTDKGISRYDTYSLTPDRVDFIINNLNRPSSTINNNILTLSFEMGKGQLDTEDTYPVSEPTNDIFLPLLMVSLKEAVDGKTIYYFPLDPESETFTINYGKNLSSANSKEPLTEIQQISPKVAELFILKWQALLDIEIINSFEGLAADSVYINNKGDETAEISFSSQKLRRVNSFTFDNIETEAIIKEIENALDASKNVGFFVNLGAGLVVADFHPFNFRPIIRIETTDNTASIDSEGGNEDSTNVKYFDTSRPCPPFCDLSYNPK